MGQDRNQGVSISLCYVPDESHLENSSVSIRKMGLWCSVRIEILLWGTSENTHAKTQCPIKMLHLLHLDGSEMEFSTSFNSTTQRCFMFSGGNQTGLELNCLKQKVGLLLSVLCLRDQGTVWKNRAMFLAGQGGGCQASGRRQGRWWCFRGV